MSAKTHLPVSIALVASACLSPLLPLTLAQAKPVPESAERSPVSLVQRLSQPIARRDRSSSKTVKSSPQPLATEHLAEYVKPAVVRIGSGCTGKAYWSKIQKTYDLSAVGSGSGYFVNSNGYIVTNAHVIELTQKPEHCKNLLFQEFVQQLAQERGEEANLLFKNRKALDEIAQKSELVKFQPVHVVLLPNGDQLPFEVKVSGAPVGEGKDVAIIKINVKNAPVLKLADSDQVRLLEPITVAGYPAAGDSDLFGDSAFHVASFTEGKISARKTLKDGSPVLQISAPATHGNSGGPVINNRGEVVGIVTFGGNRVYGQEISGFSFMVPSNTIMEFVKQAEIRNEESVVNQKYREGLALHGQGNCQQASVRFKEVKHLFPQHSEVENLIQSCRSVSRKP